jgi:hypothetical protein
MKILENYRFLGEFKGDEAPQSKKWGIYKPKTYF